MGFPWALSVAMFWSAAAGGQTLLTGSGRGAGLPPSDAAILSSRHTRSDLACTVKPVAPALGFDLGFHAGYDLSVPIREMAGNGNQLTAIFSVTPEERPDDPVYFSQQWKVPAIGVEAGGRTELRGTVVLGEGRYQISWLLRDMRGRYCSAHWRVAVDRSVKDRQIQLRIPAGAVLPSIQDPFEPEAPVKREGGRLLNVLVLLHVASQSPGAAVLTQDELEAIPSILRSVAREPRIGSYSIAAFNLERDELLFLQTGRAGIDFPALGDAVKRLKLGTVEIGRLIEKDTGVHFLGELLAVEAAVGPIDAIIFIGPKLTVFSSTLERSLKALGAIACPAFYLAYSADAGHSPWRDVIGSAVKFWKGPEYVITRPRDLPVAWADVMARLSERAATPEIPDRAGMIKGLAAQK